MSPTSKVKLNYLFLEVLQVETQKRPYCNLALNENYFKNKLKKILNSSDFEIITDFIIKKSVQNLRIFGIKIPEECYNLLIKSFAELSTISLVNTQLTDHFFNILSKNAESLRKLKHLKLVGNSISTKAAEHLQKFLVKSSSIELLDVGSCSLTPITFAMIADGVWKCKSIKSLNMSNLQSHSLTSSIDGQKIGFLIAILMKQTNLTEIHFGSCRLKENDIEPIAEYLKENQNRLLVLDLRSNQIGSGVKYLIEAIASNSSSKLLELNISHNSLGEIGGEEIAHNLCKTNLKYLNIGHNEIPAHTMNFILQTIKKPKLLKILCMFGNKFNSTTGNILNRQIDAGVFCENCIDVKIVKDENIYKIVRTEILC